MLKKIAIVLAVLIVVVAIGARYVWSNLDSIVKSNIEKYGTAATQADVTLDSVKLSITTGQGTLSGLDIGNPKGFSSAKAFKLGSISVKLDTGSITGNGPIIISQIVIDKPEITYEISNSGTTNLQTIQHNAQAYAASIAPPAKTAGTNTAASNANSGPGRKIIIDDLVISNGEVAINQAALSQIALKGKPLSTSLPTIHLTGIGKNSGGATAAQVAQQVLSSVVSSASKAAISDLARQQLTGALKGVGGGALGGITGATGGIGGDIKNLIGQ